MADVEADRGGQGKERRIGERRAFFSPPPPPTVFFCVTATQDMDSRPLNKRKQRTRNGWTGKHGRRFKKIPYHVSP